MPGKQMAIDADLNAGQITDAEARDRRVRDPARGRLLRRDGRRLEVRAGDAIAGIIIVAINLFGGIVVGMLQQDMSFSDALHTFSS